jgi:hypothetical protein
MSICIYLYICICIYIYIFIYIYIYTHTYVYDMHAYVRCVRASRRASPPAAAPRRWVRWRRPPPERAAMIGTRRSAHALTLTLTHTHTHTSAHTHALARTHTHTRSHTTYISIDLHLYACRTHGGRCHVGPRLSGIERAQVGFVGPRLSGIARGASGICGPSAKRDRAGCKWVLWALG